MSDDAGRPAPAVRLGIFERACDLLAKLSLVAMMVIIGGGVILRYTIGYSWQGTDEVAGYLVVAITFLSLATCQAYRGYHELQVVKARLSPRGVVILDTVLHGVCLVAALILLWQFSRLVQKSFAAQDVSVSSLRTPFWIPQLTMPLGVAAYCLVLVKDIVLNFRKLAAPAGLPPRDDGHRS